MIDKVLFSSENHDWRTPTDLFNYLDKMFRFDCDFADNNGITNFMRDSKGEINNQYHNPCDSLETNWNEFGKVGFLNPPYDSKLQTQFLEKAVESKIKVVCLLPSRTDTIKWHELVFKNATEIYFIKSRLQFIGAKNSAPFPSAVVVLNKKKKNRDIKFFTLGKKKNDYIYKRI